MKLVFATNNEHKLREVQNILGDKFEILSLKDIACVEDIPETADTLEGNALLKAKYVYERYGYSCFADDTGLEVEALDMAPGVYSARFAGSQKNADDNMQKLLSDMNKINNRKARFRTVISLIIDGNEIFFEGIVNGHILETPCGEKGFGYDPVFKPDGYEQSFAQMNANLKNEISHRGRAVARLIEYLNSIEA
ncbi:MAG: non-canonical purine NTP diphosphatase [Prolixibacteraceae bacterium]|jgi:XTP/dITP diphosphohydrolase|nr:non-canonical purine NTP diphosphatase [Prolixibacteraceae bacterium]